VFLILSETSSHCLNDTEEAFAQVREDFTTPRIALSIGISEDNRDTGRDHFIGGDTIRFDAKALVLRKGNLQERTAEGMVFTIVISDPKNITVFNQDFTADRKGEFNFTFPVTQNLRSGNYDVRYSSVGVELVLHGVSFDIAPRETEFIDLSNDHTFRITPPANAIKFGESFQMGVEICPSINFADISDDSFVEAATGEKLPGLQWIVLVFELHTEQRPDAKATSLAFLKSNTCNSEVEIGPGFFPAPGEWSLNVSARWPGKDGSLYQVRMENSTVIVVDSLFASGAVQPVQLPDVNAYLAATDWSSDRASILIEYNASLGIVDADTGRLQRIVVWNQTSQNGPVNSVFDSPIDQALFSADSKSLYVLASGSLYNHDIVKNTTAQFTNLDVVNDFDVTEDGRIIYSRSDGFWIADADLSNSRRFQNLYTGEHSNFDASADGSRVVLLKDNEWVTIDTLSGSIEKVPRSIEPLGCSEDALMAPNGEMVLIKSTYCAYRGGAVSGYISIAALDGSFEEFIVPPDMGVPGLILVSDDGSNVMFSLGGPRTNFVGLYSEEGIYRMTLGKAIPEFEVALVPIITIVALTGVVFSRRVLLSLSAK
jgi:hypothetical protein